MLHHFTQALQELNWLAVISAAIAAFVIGGLWYSPALFSKAWMRENKIIEAEHRKDANLGLVFGTTFILQVIAAIFMGVVTQHMNVSQGSFTGFIIGVVWVATSIGTHYLFERKSMTLFLINAGYSIVLLTVMGAILGAWH